MGLGDSQEPKHMAEALQVPPETHLLPLSHEVRGLAYERYDYSIYSKYKDRTAPFYKLPPPPHTHTLSTISGLVFGA